jgi:CheY-like chemotaxis protein
VARILVVEDSPDNMKLFRTLLTLKGHEVTGLAGGEGLLETLVRVEPELVLMDIQLPGKDGFALLSEIRESPHRHLRVLALTAHAMSGDRERAMQALPSTSSTRPDGSGRPSAGRRISGAPGRSMSESPARS